MAQCEAIVYMRSVQWEVVVPSDLHWQFMQAFGEAFPIEHGVEGLRRIRQVDSYSDHPNGWHVRVSVDEDREQHLLQFCRGFFGSRNIEFRCPESLRY